MSIKVAIYGQKYNGKTTLARELQTAIYNLQSGAEPPIPIRSFASEIKETLSRLTNIPVSTLMHYKEQGTIPDGWRVTVRQALQNLGECGRQIHLRMWVDRTICYPSYIIDDGRHVEEIGITYADGAYNVMIIDPAKVNTDPHPSEIHLYTLVQDYYKGIKRPRIHEVFINHSESNINIKNIKGYAESLAKFLLSKATRNET